MALFSVTLCYFSSCTEGSHSPLYLLYVIAGCLTSAHASLSQYKPPSPLTRTLKHNNSPHFCPLLSWDDNPGRCWSNVTVLPPGERPCHTTSTSQLHLRGGGYHPQWGVVRKEACCSYVLTQKHQGTCIRLRSHACIGLTRLMFVTHTWLVILFCPSFCRTIHDLSTTSSSRTWTTTKQGELTWWTRHGKTTNLWV